MVKLKLSELSQVDLKKCALLQLNNEELIEENLEEVVEEFDDCYSYNGEEYLIVTDNEADEYWEEELNNYLEECIYPELQENLKNYFDDEAWKRDARFDGRAQSLNHYDGGEETETVLNEEFYLYRRN